VDRNLTRRQFLQRAGAASAALAAIAQVPSILQGRGLLAEAAALEPDVVRDTLNGLVAFVVPGQDEYSKAQGETSPSAGGLDARCTDFLIESLDGYVPAPDVPFPNDSTVPLSAAVATFLNDLALQVNPLAAGGSFLSPFARLSFAEKGEAFRRMEALDLGDADLPEPFTSSSGNLRFVAGALLEFAAFGSYSEWAVFDGEGLRARPVGWELTGYEGPGDGWDELLGYYQDRREVSG
jgi:hypothetical protein